jgi:putative transposon-encoded protein/uncharacterized membrane protein YgcG
MANIKLREKKMETKIKSKASAHGNGAHVIVPKDWIGKRVKVKLLLSSIVLLAILTLAVSSTAFVMTSPSVAFAAATTTTTTTQPQPPITTTVRPFTDVQFKEGIVKVILACNQQLTTKPINQIDPVILTFCNSVFNWFLNGCLSSTLTTTTLDKRAGIIQGTAVLVPAECKDVNLVKVVEKNKTVIKNTFKQVFNLDIDTDIDVIHKTTKIINKDGGGGGDGSSGKGNKTTGSNGGNGGGSGGNNNTTTNAAIAPLEQQQQQFTLHCATGDIVASTADAECPEEDGPPGSNSLNSPLIENGEEKPIIPPQQEPPAADEDVQDQDQKEEKVKVNDDNNNNPPDLPIIGDNDGGGGDDDGTGGNDNNNNNDNSINDDKKEETDSGDNSDDGGGK